MTNMDKIFRFLDDHVEVALATVEDDKPRIRIFQVMKRDGRTLFFATSAQKHVYRQLQANPHVELASSSGNVFVRVAGKADFSVDDATCREIYDTNPVLQRLYEDYQKLAYFRVEPEAIEYFDLTPTPPICEYNDLREAK